MTNLDTIVKILEECGVSLYDTEVTSEFDKRIFTIYITSKEGITLDKCAHVSRILSPIFDVFPLLLEEPTIIIFLFSILILSNTSF